jgi:multidrug efflux pump subunit AcrA (membrane-fusion protein)
VEVVSGLQPGDEVVAAGSFYLKTALLRERIGHGH